MRSFEDRRARTVATLRERALAGSLTLDAFASLFAGARRARTAEELDMLLEGPEGRGRGRRPRAAGELMRRAIGAVFRSPGRAPPAVQIEVSVPRDAAAVTVGRSSDCDVVVGEETVSRFHAELLHGNGAWIVRDLGSTNGTWLNGSRVCEARLRRGDVLSLGGLRMELRL